MPAQPSPPPAATAARPSSAPAAPGRAFRRAAWVAAVALAAFLVGFGWQYLRARGAADDRDRAVRALTATRLEATLAGAALEAQQGNYELARQRTSAYFTGLQRRLTPGLGADEQATARQLLGRRDVIITTLARNDPAAASVLRELLQAQRALASRAGLDSTFAAAAVPASGAAGR